jgi:hypothetical protein
MLQALMEQAFESFMRLAKENVETQDLEIFWAGSWVSRDRLSLAKSKFPFRMAMV